MTRGELESILNCRIILVDKDQIGSIQDSRVSCRLFYALYQPSDKYILCVVGDEDLSAYSVPTDYQVNAIYNAVLPQLIDSQITMGDLTRERYGYENPVTQEKIEVYLVDGEYVRDGVTYPAEDCMPLIKSLATTAIVGGDIIGD